MYVPITTMHAFIDFVFGGCAGGGDHVVGVAAVVGKAKLERVAEAEVMMQVPSDLRAIQVFGRSAGDWARDCHDKLRGTS